MKRSPATPAAPRFRTSNDDRPPLRPRHSSLLPALASIVTLAALLGCAARTAEAPPSDTRAGAPATALAADTADPAPPPIVRIRAYRSSPDVTVVAWSPAASAYGLRVALRREDGAPVGALRRGDHAIYVDRDFLRFAGIEGHAVVTEGVPLRRFFSYDQDACLDGPPCSPASIVAFSIPEATLRENRDSLVVWFTSGHRRTISLRPDLLDAYLSTVDSLTVALRR